MPLRTLLITIFLFAQTVLFGQESKKDSLDNVWNKNADSTLAEASRYFAASEISKAFLDLKKAQALFQKSGNKEGQCAVSIAFAKYYEKNLLWPDAERYYKKALLLIGSTDSTSTSAEITFNLAKALYQQNKYEEALKFNQTSLDQYTGLGSKGKMAECYVSIARIKIAQRNYVQAENLILKRALPLFRSASDDFGRIGCFDVLGKSYYGQKKYSPAKWFFIQANTQSRNLKDTIGIISSLVELGKVKISIQDYDLAMRDFKEAESLSRRKGALSLMGEVKKAYAMLYKQTGNKKAYSSNTGSYDKISDSLSTIQSNRTAAALQAENDADKILNAPTPPPLKAPESSNKISFYWLAAFMVLIAIAFICFRQIRNNKSKRS